MGHGGFESYNISMSITCKCYCDQFETQFKIGSFQKRSIPHPQRKFLPSGDGGGGGSDCLKNILNLYKMSGEGEGVLLISSMGGMDLFWSNVFKFNIEFTISKYHQYKQ